MADFEKIYSELILAGYSLVNIDVLPDFLSLYDNIKIKQGAIYKESELFGVPESFGENLYIYVTLIK